jgi:hypothetical protein
MCFSKMHEVESGDTLSGSGPPLFSSRSVFLLKSRFSTPRSRHRQPLPENPIVEHLAKLSLVTLGRPDPSKNVEVLRHESRRNFFNRPA